MPSSLKLYALCDQGILDHRGLSLSSFVALCQQHQAEIIQYRDKDASVETIKKQLIALRALWDGFLIVNDHFELAPYCDGVHLGQEDFSAIDKDPSRALKALKVVIGEDKIIGLSTHNAQEIAVANTLDLHYIGLGAYRQTDTKAVNHVLGEHLDALASTSTHPVAAIGGVRFEDTFEHVTYRVMGNGLFS